MPCSSDGYPDSRDTELRRLRDVEAMLCAVMSVTPGTVIDKIDYKEAGVSKSTLIRWWEEHRRKDDERRSRERAREAQRKAKADALAKLSPAERKVLGL